MKYRLKEESDGWWTVEYKKWLIWKPADIAFRTKEIALQRIELHKTTGKFYREKQWEYIN